MHVLYIMLCGWEKVLPQEVNPQTDTKEYVSNEELRKRIGHAVQRYITALLERLWQA